MTVKDLMSRLAAFDPDALVVLTDVDGYEPGVLAGIDECQYDPSWPDGGKVLDRGTVTLAGVPCLVLYPKG